jgi:hypothetical protein
MRWMYAKELPLGAVGIGLVALCALTAIVIVGAYSLKVTWNSGSVELAPARIPAVIERR